MRKCSYAFVGRALETAAQFADRASAFVIALNRLQSPATRPQVDLSPTHTHDTHNVRAPLTRDPRHPSSRTSLRQSCTFVFHTSFPSAGGDSGGEGSDVGYGSVRVHSCEEW